MKVGKYDDKRRQGQTTTTSMMRGKQKQKKAHTTTSVHDNKQLVHGTHVKQVVFEVVSFYHVTCCYSSFFRSLSLVHSFGRRKVIILFVFVEYSVYYLTCTSKATNRMRIRALHAFHIMTQPQEWRTQTHILSLSVSLSLLSLSLYICTCLLCLLRRYEFGQKKYEANCVKLLLQSNII